MKNAQYCTKINNSEHFNSGNLRKVYGYNTCIFSIRETMKKIQSMLNPFPFPSHLPKSKGLQWSVTGRGRCVL